VSKKGWKSCEIQPNTQASDVSSKLLTCVSKSPACPLHVLSLQDQQVQWRDALQQLQAGSSSAGALTMSQLSQQLQDLYTQLLALPDPLPAVKDAAALTAKTQGGGSSRGARWQWSLPAVQLGWGARVLLCYFRPSVGSRATAQQM
jgi:hypothetical protein